MVLSYLIYTSEKSEDVTEKDVAEIIDVAKTRNLSMNISGVLIDTGSFFIQYLEGDRKSINSLYNKIRKDKRHHNVQLALFEDLKGSYIFKDWGMAALECNDDTKRILKKYLGAKMGCDTDLSGMPAVLLLDMLVEISVLYTLDWKMK